MRFATGFCLVSAAAVTSSMAGCWQPLIYGEKASTVAHVVQSPLVVETGNGSVSASAVATMTDVQIKARIGAISQERLDAATISAERLPEGVLRVSVSWPGGQRQSNESASFTITMPDAKGVTVATSNGSVTLVSLAGPASVTTTNGPIDIKDHAGPVDVRSSNGAITVANAPDSVKAKSSNGPINVSLTDSATAPVTLNTSNGSIKLSFGGTWSGVLDVGTSNGKISVLNQTHKNGEVKVGSSSDVSTLKTSNGSITVDRR